MGVVADIKKASLTSTDFYDFGVSTGKQWTNFKHLLREQPNIFREARIEVLPEASNAINRLAFNQRLLVPAYEGNNFNESDTKKPTYDYINIDLQKFWGEIPVTYDAMEDNIRGASLKEDIRKIINEKVAEDLADVFWNSNSDAPTDPMYADLDGFLHVAEESGVTYDFANNPISKEGLANSFRTMPSQYRHHRDRLKFFLHTSPTFDYQESLTDVSVPGIVSSKARISDYLPPFMGIKFAESPKINVYDNGGKENSKGLLTDPRNLIIGFHRKISIKMIDDERNERFLFHVSTRVGCAMEEPEGAVFLTNIQHKI